jgi:hypothetical protein
MSFLKIGDRAAGAIKSGGTTRRAAKMVCLILDHPEIEGFVNWKVEEEKKVAALIAAGYSSIMKVKLTVPYPDRTQTTQYVFQILSSKHLKMVVTGI